MRNNIPYHVANKWEKWGTNNPLFPAKQLGRAKKNRKICATVMGRLKIELPEHGGRVVMINCRKAHIPRNATHFVLIPYAMLRRNSRRVLGGIGDMAQFLSVSFEIVGTSGRANAKFRNSRLFFSSPAFHVLSCLNGAVRC